METNRKRHGGGGLPAICTRFIITWSTTTTTTTMIAADGRCRAARTRRWDDVAAVAFRVDDPNKHARSRRPAGRRR